jgi:hypothetical protein
LVCKTGFVNLRIILKLRRSLAVHLVSAFMQRIFFEPPECDFDLINGKFIYVERSDISSQNFFALSPNLPFKLFSKKFTSITTDPQFIRKENVLQNKSSICGKKIKNGNQFFYSVTKLNVLFRTRKESIGLLQKLKMGFKI